MYRKVQIFVENQEIELFNDEQIFVNSSVQNISDIGKVFTDFSQTFTIPCSNQNNYIFEHYYNNDVDNQIDHQLRRAARIEIDTIPFRTGKIQIEKGQLKNGQPENYQVTFFGEVVTLKDLIGEDKLFDLDHSTIDHTYSGAEVQARIEDNTDYDVHYPLISSDRVWQYGDLTSNDIANTVGSIDFTSLFPAVRVKSIFDLIATQYGLTFTGSFLDNPKFTNAYLWYKNKEQFSFYSQPLQLEFGEAGLPTDYLYNNTVQLRYILEGLNSPLAVPPYDIVENISHEIQVVIGTGSSIDYLLDVYVNGVYYMSFQGNGAQIFDVYELDNGNLFAGDKDITFYLRSEQAMSFTCGVIYNINYVGIDIGSLGEPLIQTYSDGSDVTLTTTATTDLKSLAPDMKIVDLINGIVNTFNLTCYGINSTTFKFEPLETYYNTGKNIDITEYVVETDITVERPKLYKNINFTYEQSQSFLNREFFDLFRREYGNLSASFDYDGGDYNIKLPFESILHTKFTNYNLQVGYCLGTEPEYKNYIPKPVLLYRYDYQDVDVSFYLNDGTTNNLLTTYFPFGQDTRYANQTYTLNWGSEISSFELGVVNNTLYREYYEPYILNLYNPKTRIVYVKTRLPLRILTSIKLNDSLIIRDKKYLINDMKTNLTNGEVDFVLISNWRETLVFGGAYTIDCASQTLSIPFSVPDGFTVTIGSPLESQFATPDDTTPTAEQTINFTITSNSGNDRTNTFPLTIVSDAGTETQYLVITQKKCRRPRVVTGTGFTFRTPRITENKGYRILE